MGSLGRILVTIGALLLAFGALLWLWEKAGFRVPGDLVFRGRNWAFYFPLGTSLLLSALLTLILWLFSRR